MPLQHVSESLSERIHLAGGLMSVRENSQGSAGFNRSLPFPSAKDCSLPCSSSSAGLFEQRVEQYLEELPDTEQSGMNKFLRGLGKQPCH